MAIWLHLLSSKGILLHVLVHVYKNFAFWVRILKLHVITYLNIEYECKLNTKSIIHIQLYYLNNDDIFQKCLYSVDAVELFHISEKFECFNCRFR